MTTIPKPIDKIWGTTDALLHAPLFEMHRLTVKPWHRCSMHVHRFKHNVFYVIAGVLYVDSILSDPHGKMESARIGPGDIFTVAPGIHHQFRTGPDSCYALEMYYVESLSEDIIRRDVGCAI